MGVQGGVGARGTCRRFHPLSRKGRDERISPAAHAPLRDSPPVWPVGSLRKAWLLSFLTRGANGGIIMKEATSRVGQAQDGGGPRLVCHGSGGGAAADGPALGRPASMRAGQCGGCRRRDGGTAHDGLIVSRR